MENYKTSTSRLAILFRNERDNWKERALEKQKKVRALEIKVRDLSNSREIWKKRAISAEKELLKLQKEGEELSKKSLRKKII